MQQGLKWEVMQNQYPSNLIIPAAGMGTRLQYKTKNIPKIMVKLNDKTIFQYQLEMLKTFSGISDIHFILGYKADLLSQYVNSLDLPYKVHFYKNEDYSSTGCSFFTKVLNKSK